MRLVPVRGNPDAAPLLYELLSERPEENWISHEQMPTPGEHEAFVAEHPFRMWYLIDVNGTYVGAIEATDRNEIGIALLKKYQRQGYGRAALTKFMETNKPLPPIPAVRTGHWVANIAIHNNDSKIFFAHMRFYPVQETWQR